MNYKKHYDTLIARGQRTLIHGYRENHHIIPKCMGGTNKLSNRVWLTAEEHYVAHQLLVKIYPGNKNLIYAAKMMTIGNGRHNKLYGWLRKQFSDSISLELKGRKSTQSVETRQAAKEKTYTPYSCICCKKEFSGKKHLSYECKGPKVKYVWTQEHKDNLSKSLTGITRTQEFKDNLSKQNLGKKQDPGFSQKIKDNWVKRKAVKSAVEK